MRLRIGHVSATFPPYFGGTGNVCYQNARELVRRGHDVHVFTAAVDGVAASEDVEGIAVTRLRSVLRYGNARVLPGLLQRMHGFDVIHLHYPFFGGEIAALAALWSRTPLVVTYHQDVLLKGPIRLLEASLRHTLGRFALRYARKVLFTTLDYGRASYVYPMLQSGGRRVDELPNGVDVTSFTPPHSRAAEREALGLPENGKIALLVAALDRAHYFKGVDILLDAMSRLPDDVSAVIIGEGDLRPSYEARVRRQGLESRIRFAGRVSDADLPAYYRSADVTVLPSTTMGEAFGLVLLESMACGTPVIASDLPGVRAVISEGADGFLVSPGSSTSLENALRRLLTDDVLREDMGRQGRSKVERCYDWRLIGDRLEGVYREVIDRKHDFVVNPASGED